MIKRFLPSALILAWAPMALAFPPCPGPELQLLPLGSPAAATELWLQAEYVMWGNEDIIDQVKNPTAPRSKCKDRLPVPDANNSDGTIQLSPAYADLGGFGIISLPELPFVANNHLHLQYTLHFTVDNALLVNTGDWIDLAQLEFAHDREQANPLSAVYRVRKIQRGKGPATLEVIESRADIGPPYTKPPLSDRVVAQIPLAGEEDQTAIALRWTQFAQTPIAAESIGRFEDGPVIAPRSFNTTSTPSSKCSARSWWTTARPTRCSIRSRCQDNGPTGFRWDCSTTTCPTTRSTAASSAW